MTINFTKTFIFLLLVGLSSQVDAQNANILWSEDFTDGIPETWTNEDPSGNDAFWTWCSDPATGPAESCPSIWDSPTNQQIPFESATALTGFVTMDSDEVGNITSNHLSELTTAPIDLTGQSTVFFSMQTHIGVYTVDASEGALLRISTDLENWTDYVLFPNLDTGTRWSENPAFPVLNISDAAAGNTIYLQFQWNGNYEYHWSLDDLVLYDGDPRFENDLRVDDFYALSPNYSYPEGQLEDVRFLADISNQGALEQSGVTLTASVEENGNEIFSTSASYEPLPIDTAFENTILPDAFSPDGMAGTVYDVNYTVSATEADDNPEDNTQSYQFMVSDTLFAKVPVPDASIRPAFNGGEVDYQWAYGTHYHVVQGAGKFARTMSFSLTGTEENAGTDVLVSLYKLTDDGSDVPADFRLVTPEERGDRIAVTVYSIQGDENFLDPITVPLAQINGDPVPLEDDTDYLAMIEFIVNGQVSISMGVSRDISYDAQDFISDSLNVFRYAQLLAVGDDISLENYSAGGFAGTVTPFVNLSIGDSPVGGTSTNDQFLSDKNKVVVSPNPANNYALLALDLEEMSKEVEIGIFDAKGQKVSTQSLENVHKAQTELDLRDLAEGFYFIRVQTDAGVMTRRLVVSK